MLGSVEGKGADELLVGMLQITREHIILIPGVFACEGTSAGAGDVATDV